jgi:hypothetical protein
VTQNIAVDVSIDYFVFPLPQNNRSTYSVLRLYGRYGRLLSALLFEASETVVD